MKKLPAQLAYIAGSLLWLGLVCYGFQALLVYGARPGPQVSPQSKWPEKTALHLNTDSYTLVMFLHPQCPCSNATVTELSLLLAHCRSIKANVLFIRPKEFAPGWEKSILWTRVSNIPGAQAMVDVDGRERNLFAAETSGQCALYDRDGLLRFSGGITGSRGHEGDNRGLSQIEAIVDRQETAGSSITTGPTFGCPLRNNALEAAGTKACLN